MFYLIEIKSPDNVFVSAHHKLHPIKSFMNNNRMQIVQQYWCFL